MKLLARRLPLLCSLALALAPIAEAITWVEHEEISFTKVSESSYAFLKIFPICKIELFVEEGRDQSSVFSDAPLKLVFSYKRSISSEALIKAADKILTDLYGKEALSAFQERIELLSQAYVDVGTGDIYTLTYVPGKGTSLVYNGESVAHAEGYDFAKLYFSIWLGEHPKSASIRRDLLANTPSFRGPSKSGQQP